MRTITRSLDRAGMAAEFRRAAALTGAAALAAVLLAASGGCATRGFVRSQMTDLRSEMGQMDNGLQAGIREAKGAASQADARAAEAATGAQSARDLALGHLGYREAGRYRIYFPYNSAEPEASSLTELEKASGDIAAHQEYLVELLGFTDAKGKTAYNYELGRRRAEAVLRALAGKSPAQLNRYMVVSYGKTPPESEAADMGQGAQRRQVAVVLIERTAQTRQEAVSQK
jgi:outer membrane protein OmpA-like peptidoglycan-associated protein